MNYENHIYIASCVFTKQYPNISEKIQRYLKERFYMRIIRCCVPNYKIEAFEKSMPDGYRERWKGIPSYQEFKSGEVMVSICHNCSAIFQESKPDVKVKSIWELVLEDDRFPFPDYHQEEMALQDCWRTRGNVKEQAAVRELLRKMNVKIVEMPYNHEDFCGVSLYQPSPPRNLKLAPNRFVVNASGKFMPYTKEDQEKLMKEHCAKISTEKAVAYCHYCVTGLKIGGKKGIHLAELLFL